MQCVHYPREPGIWYWLKRKIAYDVTCFSFSGYLAIQQTLTQSSLQESKVRLSIWEAPQGIEPLIFAVLLPRSSHWCWTESQEGQKLCIFINAMGGCGNCPLWGLYLMPSLGCSECTKTSGCLWSRLASCCPKKFFLNKWQQGRGKVTLSPHSFSQRLPCLNLGRAFFELIHITCHF